MVTDNYLNNLGLSFNDGSYPMEDERYYWHNVNEKTEACTFILGHPESAHTRSQCFTVPSDRDAILIQHVTASVREFGQ